MFDAILKSRSPPLGEVGMCNCGKSFWARLLRDDLHCGTQSVEDDIEKALSFSLGLSLSLPLTMQNSAG